MPALTFTAKARSALRLSTDALTRPTAMANPSTNGRSCSKSITRAISIGLSSNGIKSSLPPIRMAGWGASSRVGADGRFWPVFSVARVAGLPTAEQKEVARKGILPRHALDQHGKPVDALAHVGAAEGQVHLYARRKQHHDAR